MFTYITTTTVPSFPDLQEQYGITYSQVNWTVAIPALGLAVGPLIWSSLSDIYGRRIIFIVGTLMAFGATIGAAKAPNYGGYMAARFFQGLGVSPGATVGLAAINDMFYEHERGQKIGLWVLAIDSGLFVGPIIGGFMNIVSAAWIQWLTAILFGLLLALELAFMPETLYPRNHMLTKLPMASGDDETGVDIEKVGRRRSEAEVVSLPRTKKLFFINIKPVPGLRHPKSWDSILRFVLTLKFLAVTITVGVFCFLWYWWVLSVITMLPAAYVQYTPQIQGLLFIGLLLGTLFAEVFLGGRLSDWLCVKLAKSNGGTRLPEMRLWLIYPAGTLSAIGLIIWGISIDKGYHWIVGQIAFFLFAAGIQMGNTTVCSYIVDAYPLQSMSVITFYSVFLNLSAFIDPVSPVPFESAFSDDTVLHCSMAGGRWVDVVLRSSGNHCLLRSFACVCATTEVWSGDTSKVGTAELGQSGIRYILIIGIHRLQSHFSLQMPPLSVPPWSIVSLLWRRRPFQHKPPQAVVCGEGY
jgi:MFS family permease